MNQELHPSQSPEKGSEKPYLDEAKSIIEQAADIAPGISDRYDLVKAHVDEMLAAADRGEIEGSSGKYSRDALITQFESFLEANRQTDEQRQGQSQYLHIPRAGGMRDSIKALSNSEATFRELDDALSTLVYEQNEQFEQTAERPGTSTAQELGGVSLQAAGVEVPAVEPAAEAEAPAEETEAEMYSRYARESKQELNELYAELRGVEPGSWEAATIENQIKLTKQDVGEYARMAAKASGNTNWH